MKSRFYFFWVLLQVAGLGYPGKTFGQESVEPPPVPQGVEVLARGPVHEAFATPTTEPVPTTFVPRRPPPAIEEMPPEEKPEGDVVWIGGYWAWDDDRKDFLWVSGIWRSVPPGKQWVAGYWREEGNQMQWVGGFWTTAAPQGSDQEITYMPAPPAPPAVAPLGEPPAPDSFYVPGVWVWAGNHYAWRSGYWARVQPGYVWVAAHYQWTPSGYIYIPGYWDLVVAKRGVLFAPVFIDTTVVSVSFVYTPAFVVRDTIVLDALFVRPCYCHYYFGDYYGPVYRDLGFESCIVYSRRCYDPIFVYARWEYRDVPRWETVQLDICLGRHAGRVAAPPRTLVQQNTIVQQNITNVTNVNNVNTVVNNTTNNTTNLTQTNVNNSQVLVPVSRLSAEKGVRTVSLDSSTRIQAKQQAQAVQKVALQRTQAEVALGGGVPTKPRTSSLKVAPIQPVGKPMTATAPSPKATQPSNPVTATGTSPKAVPPSISTPMGKPPTSPATSTKLAPPAKPPPANLKPLTSTGSVSSPAKPAGTVPSGGSQGGPGGEHPQLNKSPAGPNVLRPSLPGGPANTHSPAPGMGPGPSHGPVPNQGPMPMKPPVGTLMKNPMGGPPGQPNRPIAGTPTKAQPGPQQRPAPHKPDPKNPPPKDQSGSNP